MEQKCYVFEGTEQVGVLHFHYGSETVPGTV